MLRVKNNKGKILAIDFGEKHIGLADCYEDRKIVFARGEIEDYKNLNNLFRQIKAFCEDNDIVKVVFGVPTGADGEVTEQTTRYKKIGGKLEEYLETLEVVFVDESYSTFEAEKELQNKLIDSSYSGHEMSAVHILEKYLKSINLED